MHESTRETNNTFTFHLFADSRLACTQDNHLNGEVHVVNVIQFQKSILELALLVNEGKHEARQIRVIVVENAMRCEVDHAKLLQPLIEYASATRVKVERCH